MPAPLEFADFAEEWDGKLTIPKGHIKTPMAHSSAKGLGLVSNGHIGADLIHVEAGKGFVPHTHPGDHLLFVMEGSSTITYDGKIYQVDAGTVYMVEGNVPHAVGAITDTVILAIGSPHKLVDSEERMVPKEYEAIVSEVENLRCLICSVSAELPERLHNRSCTHCPCPDCVN